METFKRDQHTFNIDLTPQQAFRDHGWGRFWDR
jgi:hypothetical protein